MRTISQGAEAETALAGGIEGAGHRVPDQQEPRQRQHPAVEDEQHVAQHGAAALADITEEGQHVPRRPVGAGEQAPVDGLCRRRFGQQPRDTQADKYCAGEQDQKADTGKQALLPQQTWPFFGPDSCGFIFLRFPGLQRSLILPSACSPARRRLARHGALPSAGSVRQKTRAASVRERVNSGANRKRSAPMAVSSPRRPGWRGRAEAACVRQPGRARWRRWRHAVHRAGSGASRASARPLAG